MVSFQLAVDRREGGALVTVSGEVDLAAASEFGAGLREAFDQGNEVTVDVSGVTFMDSTGVAGFARLIRQGADLTVEGASPAVARLLEITGIDRLIRVRAAPADD